ncbi:hypothetical protein [Vogesella mureinivorans]|uniref:hypothetical protein n=1 Tax=Vogesella mureinivorans TaxID=657276 RepID=UPI0011CAA9AC|nr:hypothetical protein [Vogesella mureinivorans]
MIVFEKKVIKKVSAYNAVEILSIIVLLILYRAITGRTKSITRNRLAIIFDHVITHSLSRDERFKFLVKPWSPDGKLNTILIILRNAKYIEWEASASKEKFTLKQSGQIIVDNLIKDGLFVETDVLISNVIAEVTEVYSKKYYIGAE